MTLKIRRPLATRPWQHVLEPLSGYLLLGQCLLQGQRNCAEPWNFGPAPDGNQTVHALLVRLRALWPELKWEPTGERTAHEAGSLQLDSTKAQQRLGWRPVWSIDDALRATAVWYGKYMDERLVVSNEQLDEYVTHAARARLPWCGQ